jgi:hypothetical protein
VKRLLAVVLGALGLTAWLKRRRERSSLSPADDLKATLAESRSADAATDPEPPAEEPDVDARRADVHARAREAMDELSS